VKPTFPLSNRDCAAAAPLEAQAASAAQPKCIGQSDRFIQRIAADPVRSFI
jgi:hypothetical protein